MSHRDQLLGRLEGARAPRYTSYPPANHFTAQVGEDRAAAWLRDLPEGDEVSIYAHVPFCRRLCWFCACRTQGTRTDAPLVPYVDALLAEIDRVAAGAPALRAGRIHLGGGTPTILPPALLRSVLARLAARFDPVPGAEISVEIDPTVLDPGRLDALAEAGLTRASIGVQDFDPAVQRAIGRAQTPDETARAVEGLRARGVPGLNLDLLYGLPHQDLATLERTLRDALALRPDRVALYGYAHVPWMARRQVMIPVEALPDAAARLRLFDRAAAILRSAGFVQVGIDHFAWPEDGLARAARTGILRRNFQGYTDDQAETLLGFGASAISRLPGGFVQNEPKTGAWQSRIAAGRLGAARGHAFTPDDRLRSAMIERLMCDFRVDTAGIAHHLGRPEAEAASLAAALIEAWPDVVGQADGGILHLREPRLARLVAQTLDAYAAPSGRHSLVA